MWKGNNMNVREFYPSEIRTPINVYRDGKLVTWPIVAAHMADQPDIEVEGWIETVTMFTDENGNWKYDDFGNPEWLVADTEMYDEWIEYNRYAKELGLELAPRPKPDIRRYWGKIKWELKK